MQTVSIRGMLTSQSRCYMLGPSGKFFPNSRMIQTRRPPCVSPQQACLFGTIIVFRCFGVSVVFA